jgi:hypothetical protein
MILINKWEKPQANNVFQVQVLMVDLSPIWAPLVDTPFLGAF